MGGHPPNSQPFPQTSCSSCSRGRGRWRGWPGRGESPTSWRWSENTFWLQILLLNSASTDTVLIKNWPHLLWRTYFLVVSISPQDNESTHLGSKVSSPQDYMTVCFSGGIVWDLSFEKNTQFSWWAILNSCISSKGVIYHFSEHFLIFWVSSVSPLRFLLYELVLKLFPNMVFQKSSFDLFWASFVFPFSVRWQQNKWLRLLPPANLPFLHFTK